MIGKILREKREALGYSRERLSIKSGVSTSSIIKIEQNIRKPSLEIILQLSEALKINKIDILNQLGFFSDDEVKFYTTPILEKRLQNQVELMESTEESKVPVFDSVSAGIGYTPDAEPTGYLSLDISNCNDCVGIHVKGCSMNPTISDSAVILIRKDEQLHDGDIGVFLLNEEAFVKRYVRKDNIILLYSDNPTYQPIIVTEEDDFRICGKVIKTLNNL